LKKIGAIANIRTGFQIREAVRHINDGSHRLIQVRDFDELGILHQDDCIRFHPYSSGPVETRNIKALERQLVTVGDVLFLAKGTRCFAWAMTEEMPNTLVAGFFLVLQVKRRAVQPEYLAWWLNQPRTQTELERRRMGTHIRTVRKSELGDLEVEIPPLEVQKRISRLSQLRLREMVLSRRLAAERARLVEAVCLKAATRNEED